MYMYSLQIKWDSTKKNHLPFLALLIKTHVVYDTVYALQKDECQTNNINACLTKGPIKE
jgi:hypothetical protein